MLRRIPFTTWCILFCQCTPAKLLQNELTHLHPPWWPSHLLKGAISVLSFKITYRFLVLLHVSQHWLPFSLLPYNFCSCPPYLSHRWFLLIFFNHLFPLYLSHLFRLFVFLSLHSRPSTCQFLMAGFFCLFHCFRWDPYNDGLFVTGSCLLC